MRHLLPDLIWSKCKCPEKTASKKITLNRLLTEWSHWITEMQERCFFVRILRDLWRLLLDRQCLIMFRQHNWLGLWEFVLTVLMFRWLLAAFVSLLTTPICTVQITAVLNNWIIPPDIKESIHCWLPRPRRTVLGNKKRLYQYCCMWSL